MKKILFIAFAFACVSNAANAQAKASPTMTPLPTKAEVEKDTKTKTESAEKLSTPATNTSSTKKMDQNTANYKKAGLSDSQITEMNKAMSDLDRQKLDIENNSKLTVEQKKNGVDAIETERKAIQKKTMGADNYKKYNDMNQSKSKPVKTSKAETAN